MKIILRSYSGADYGPESLTALISAIFGDFMTIFGIYVWRKCMRKWHPKSEAVATYFACRRHPPETGFTIRYAKWSALEKSVAARAVNNYGPESAPEYDRSMIFIIWRFRLRVFSLADPTSYWNRLHSWCWFRNWYQFYYV